LREESFGSFAQAELRLAAPKSEQLLGADPITQDFGRWVNLGATWAQNHFPFFPKPLKSVPFFRETSVAPFRSNLVSDANKRVTQILRSLDPGSSSRSEAREASDVGFDH